jgi:hypothetical protein
MLKLLGFAIVLGSLGVASIAEAGECSSSTSEVAATRAPTVTAQRSAAGQARRSYSYEPSGMTRGYRSQPTRAFSNSGIRAAGAKVLGNFGS